MLTRFWFAHGAFAGRRRTPWPNIVAPREHFTPEIVLLVEESAHSHDEPGLLDTVSVESGSSPVHGTEDSSL